LPLDFRLTLCLIDQFGNCGRCYLKFFDDSVELSRKFAYLGFLPLSNPFRT